MRKPHILWGQSYLYIYCSFLDNLLELDLFFSSPNLLFPQCCVFEYSIFFLGWYCLLSRPCTVWKDWDIFCLTWGHFIFSINTENNKLSRHGKSKTMPNISPYNIIKNNAGKIPCVDLFPRACHVVRITNFKCVQDETVLKVFRFFH